MKINLAKSAGFCFGVKRAINIAIDTAQQHKKVEILGDIVHNEFVVKEVEQLGIKKVKKLTKGKSKTLLIRAHGRDAGTYKKAKQLGYTIVDATCPMVKEIHKKAQSMEKKGYTIIIIGDKNHAEVMGIIGHLKKKVFVISNMSDIPTKTIKRVERAAVVVQSTQDMAKALQIMERLSLYIKKIKLYNTICNPTKIKQKEIRQMPLQNDVMIIIGSKVSANTKRLYQISKSLNPNTYWVTSHKEVKSHWLKGAKTVGVTSGASTPDSLTTQVIAQIRSVSRHDQRCP